VVVNQDGSNTLEGGITVKCILRALSTPPLPDTKTIQCHKCEAKKVVPVETTRWICENCGQLCLFINDRALRGI
jgi:PHP family Zn ribbon phosphoesterase